MSFPLNVAGAGGLKIPSHVAPVALMLRFWSGREMSCIPVSLLILRLPVEVNLIPVAVISLPLNAMAPVRVRPVFILLRESMTLSVFHDDVTIVLTVGVSSHIIENCHVLRSIQVFTTLVFPALSSNWIWRFFLVSHCGSSMFMFPVFVSVPVYV